MADYYSILKKTIASLPESNGAARRSVYSRARNAIVSQLKAYEPPLTPSEITAEQLRLEEAIRKVEAEAAREALGLSPSPKAEPKVAPPVETAAPVAPQPEPEEEPEEEVAEAAPPPPPAIEEKRRPADPAPVNAPSPLKKEVEEAGRLGSASHEAVQNAREAFDAPLGVDKKSEGRKEPTLGGAMPAQRADEASDEEELFADDDLGDELDEPKVAPAPKTRDRRRDTRDRKSASAALSKRGGQRSSSMVPIALAAVLAIVVAAISYVIFVPQDEAAESGNAPAPIASVTPEQSEPQQAEEEPASSKNTDRLLDDNGEPAAAPDARSVTTTLITPGQTETVIVEPQPSANPLPSLSEEPAAPEGIPDQPAGGTETANASSTDADPATSTQANAGSAQRSILYEEGEDANGSGSASQGAVVWSLEDETDLSGKSQKVLIADVSIPDRNVSVNVRIKPNDDTSLPASHLVEIKYDFPEGYSSGDVVNVPGLVMKPTEEARGDALLGASVKVSPGYFWIALSSLTSERDRNLGLLRERGWIDIPMLYDNGKRGILTLEKGRIGADLVDQAISAWNAG
ncbi:hypothetical protein [Roseibium sediminis]|uniref:hypothetical protein n=1 Tax=Roseibium sediminis TaxID=1775174 RepID=UPI00123D19F4|nr:hypothetical protein [Roseibium sediminis]